MGAVAVDRIISEQIRFRGNLREALAHTYRRTADSLELLGWCQQASRDRYGHICLGQALMTALAQPVMAPVVVASNGPSQLYGPVAYWPVQFALGCNCPLCKEGSEVQLAGAVLEAWLEKPIVVWNDAPERTKDEVIKTVRALADYLAIPQEGGAIDRT